MKDPDIEARIDAIYAGTLDAFVAARKALADELKKAGKKDTAARVMAQPKPSAVAAAVNRFYAESPREFAKLLAAGERVREAFRATLAKGADASAAAHLLRSQKAQREAVSVSVEAVIEQTKAAGSPLSAQLVSRLESTLLAISTTGRFGDGPAGRLVRELEPPGLEVLADLPEPDPAPSPRKKSEPPAARHVEEDDEPRREAERKKQEQTLEGQLETIVAELEEVETAAAHAAERERAAEKKESEATDALQAARKEVTEHRALFKELERSLRAAEQEVTRAEAQLEKTEAKARAAKQDREEQRKHEAQAKSRKKELEAKRKEIDSELKALRKR